MSAKTWALALGLAFSVSAPLAHAADHKDGPVVTADPATDITDVYAWMQADSSRVFLVMNVFPAATTAARFSDSALYIFHTNNRTNGADSYGSEVNIICQFDKGTPQQVECWAGKDEYVKGNASVQSTDSAGKPVWNGISSRSGKLRVFSGLRNDPFFFNLAGYNQVRANVTGAVAAKALTFNGDGCPTMPAATLTAQALQLRQSPAGGTPADFFLPLNTLAIVLKVPVAMVNKGGPLFSVWAGSYRKG